MARFHGSFPIEMNSITFQKHRGCTSGYLGTTGCRIRVEEVGLTAKTVLKPSCIWIQVLLCFTGAWNELFQGQIPSYSDSESPGLALHHSVPAAWVLICLENRGVTWGKILVAPQKTWHLEIQEAWYPHDAFAWNWTEKPPEQRN